MPSNAIDWAIYLNIRGSSVSLRRINARQMSGLRDVSLKRKENKKGTNAAMRQVGKVGVGCAFLPGRFISGRSCFFGIPVRSAD